MDNILDYFYGMITAPRKTLADLTYGEKIREAFGIWAFTVLLLTIPSLGTGSGFLPQLFCMVVGMGLSLLLHCAVIDYAAGLFGGSGTARGITAGFMAASFPAGFFVFLTLLSALGFFELNGLLGFLLFVWMFYLDVAAIGENYCFRRGKALAVALIPYLLLLTLFVLFTAAAIIAALSGLADMQAEMNEAMALWNQI